VDVRSEHYNLAKWYDIIESALDDPDSEPIVNIADEAASEYDAIFVGGGAFAPETPSSSTFNGAGGRVIFSRRIQAWLGDR